MPNPVRQASLLPQQIPPQTAILGAVRDKFGNDIGTVTMDVNWWLFLYNIAKQLLAGGPGVPVPISPVDTIALVDGSDISSTDAIQDKRSIANAIILEGIDIDMARPDVAGLPTRITNVQALLPDVDVGSDVAGFPVRINNAQLVDIDPDIGPSLRDMANAFALATDGLLQDPAAQAQPTQVVVVSGSPFTYTAPANGLVSVTGGTVSLISIIRQTTTVATGITTGLIPVRRGDQVQISQSGVPTMIFLPN